jgi:signal transduction histidine kinase
MKPVLVWTAFAVCFAVAVVALSWSSASVLRLERAEQEARSQAALEENARLALWRMDSALTVLLAQEGARPYFQYSSFYRASGSYAHMFEATPLETALEPSPLLREAPARVLLHFQVSPEGRVTSPQVPSGAWRALSLTRQQVTREALSERSRRLAELQQKASPLIASLPRARPRPVTPRPTPTITPTPAPPEPEPDAESNQKLKSRAEFDARVIQQTTFNASNQAQIAMFYPKGPRMIEPGTAGEVTEGALAPQWLSDALVLTRRVQVNGSTYLQGCWLDWNGIQQDLLGSIRDLLPNARLEPAAPGTNDDAERHLAGLPVRLVPGAMAATPSESFSPARLSLYGAWAGLVLAGISVAGLLYGVMALSERRRVFVSAVTHELRTPLTTFRLYTDMLAQGMVTSEEKRRQYVERLQSEALRLGHLVENVLFYARLDSGRGGGVRESFDLGGLIESATERLRERVAAAGLTLTFDKPAEPVTVRADGAAVEQILVNLVDNACKYARSGAPPTVEVSLSRTDGRAVVRVRDHGPGLSASERRRLFRPFSKSDHEAAASAPGVGLGLALSRRLARAQGGDLRLDDRTAGGGATFVLSLPA